MSELSEAGLRAARRAADQARIRELTEALERSALREHACGTGRGHNGAFRECQSGHCQEVRAILVTGAV